MARDLYPAVPNRVSTGLSPSWQVARQALPRSLPAGPGWGALVQLITIMTDQNLLLAFTSACDRVSRRAADAARACFGPGVILPPNTHIVDGLPKVSGVIKDSRQWQIALRQPFWLCYTIAANAEDAGEMLMLGVYWYERWIQSRMRSNLPRGACAPESAQWTLGLFAWRVYEVMSRRFPSSGYPGLLTSPEATGDWCFRPIARFNGLPFDVWLRQSENEVDRLRNLCSAKRPQRVFGQLRPVWPGGS